MIEINLERKTKISNQILFNILNDYNVVEVKILTMLINRLVINHHLKTKDDPEVFDAEDILNLTISKDYIDKLKGKKRLSSSEIHTILTTIASLGVSIVEDEKYTKINLIKRITYDKTYHLFEIEFNEDCIDYVLLVKNNFSLVDLNIVSKLNSKYELGLYLITSIYKDTKKAIHPINWYKDFFGTEVSNGEFKRLLESNIKKMNSKYKLNIEAEFNKRGKVINQIIIKFGGK